MTADQNPTTGPTQDDIDELAACMWQLLNDMGDGGLSVCTFAKAQARVALEPSINEPIEAECIISLVEARRVIREVNNAQSRYDKH